MISAQQHTAATHQHPQQQHHAQYVFLFASGPATRERRKGIVPIDSPPVDCGEHGWDTGTFFFLFLFPLLFYCPGQLKIGASLKLQSTTAHYSQQPPAGRDRTPPIRRYVPRLPGKVLGYVNAILYLADKAIPCPLARRLKRPPIFRCTVAANACSHGTGHWLGRRDPPCYQTQLP